MSETLNLNPVIESEYRTAVTNVVIMYPDVRTTGGFRMTTDEIKSTLEGNFHSAVQRLLKRYKRNGAQITGIVYQDTSPDNFSPLFPREGFDSLVSVPVNFADWHRVDHSDLLESIYKKLGISGNTVVGGYHAFDCVAKMIQVLENKGHKVKPNLLLTNELGELLVAHKVRSILGAGYSETDRRNDIDNWNCKYQEFNRIVCGLEK